MKKIFAAALALLIAATAFGQSYPSPTYNNLTVLGTLTANVPLSSLAAQAANTVVANVTASTASPTAVALPSCNTANSALKYTSGTGLSCGTTFALTSGTLAQFAATTSAQMAGVISDETGSGSLVFGTNPTVSGATISGGTINNTPVGATTPSTGSFTTLAASSTVSGAGFSTYLASPPAIGGTAAAAGSFTNLSSSGTVSGTGFSTYLASPPTIGGTTAGDGTFKNLTATSNFTPSQTNGIVGTTTNNNVNAGSVGEFVSNTGSGVSLTSAVGANITSVSLTAGDWDVSGSIQYLPSSVTSASFLGSSVNTVSATIGSVGSANVLQFTMSSPNATHLPTPVLRLSLSATTTVFLVGLASWTGGTITANGLLRARRVR
ncbi:hypothetical protein Q8F57_027140 [Paraburkholderia terrae]|uniref:hypothetical protein n=1 Tax=Paraburkholderia terrae TaxID=311230 RepID=UPI00296A974A|nr:hypothetical protein [Paraburkholderia terrae]MDW3660294.1 hypothetical protein [Paraburkholderia terrae]